MNGRRPAPVALHDRAAEDLRFIRDTMHGATAFTALSGVGYILVGLGAVVAFAVSHALSSPADRLSVWLVDAIASVLLGLLTTALKARSAEQPVLSGPLRKFALSFAPSVAAGAVMTLMLVRHELYGYLPPLWLLCYGAGLASAGAFSVRLVPVMGMSFMALGVLAAVVAPLWADGALLLGFGGLHVGFGIVIARRYGG